jgi:hypothetical protein
MTDHSLPSWYSWVVVVLLPIMASIAVLVVSLRVNERSIQREREARLATDRVLCAVFAPLDDSYKIKPPPSTAGKTFAAGIAEARRQACH